MEFYAILVTVGGIFSVEKYAIAKLLAKMMCGFEEYVF